MSWLASIVLYLIHTFYAITNIATSLREQYFAREPLPLAAERKKVPNHLAILLASDVDTVSESFEQDILQNVEKVVEWCRQVGITRLTFYDRHGILSSLSFELRTRLFKAGSTAATTSESELEYPLTPPLSDDSPSSSRSLSPNQHIAPKLSVNNLKLGDSPRKRKSSGRSVAKRRVSRKTSTDSISPFTLHIISRNSGKAAIAGAANSFVREHQGHCSGTAPRDFKLTVNDLKTVMESESGFPPPELMLIHHITPCTQPKHVLELFGFPPWQVSLTEMHYTRYPSSWWTQTLFGSGRTDQYIPVDETDIRRALDQYAGAEMRLGK
ncbi:hypothetical protein BDW22DRAFT_1350799 [Trametopsis cervina]|nr:hypothetical protein BDW22DRAFT_1350799 [Trametopsis cervina]